MTEFKKMKWGEEIENKLRVAVYRRALLRQMTSAVREGKPVSPNIIILFAETYKKLGEPIPPDWIAKAERAKRGEVIYFKRRSDTRGDGE